jgi:FkbM family methyltransferase
MKKLIKAINLFYFFLKFKSYRVAHFLAKDSFPLERVNEISIRNGKIVVNKTGQAFTLEQVAPCAASFDLFLNIATHDKVKIDNTGKEVYITWEQVKIKAATFENFYVASELFIEGLYSLHYDKNLVVCDVGMNVGVASLYFANMKNVQKVYSFEPFPETYEAGLANFALNPALSPKIVPYNLGAGGSTGDLVIPISNVDSATKSTTDFFLQQIDTDQSNSITVKIKDIREVIQEIFTNHPGDALLLKLDCEGAEYEILDKLNESGLLPKIKVIKIEWHFKGYQPLVKLLTANGFSSVVFPRPTAAIPDMGMIYAFKMQ